jgi:glutamate-1-semialdehyde aminotransferase
MNWMKKWPGAFPVFVKCAKGAHFTVADGRDYIDLCLGETGAMTGHSPEFVAEVLARRVKELKKKGLMHPSGLQGFAARSANKSGIYSYEQPKSARFTREQEKRFRANKSAWELFRPEIPWY